MHFVDLLGVVALLSPSTLQELVQGKYFHATLPSITTYLAQKEHVGIALSHFFFRCLQDTHVRCAF